jgi:hypothetical protein
VFESICCVPFFLTGAGASTVPAAAAGPTGAKAATSTGVDTAGGRTCLATVCEIEYITCYTNVGYRGMLN